MDHKEPKTRTEKKGRDKQGWQGPYSAKHVRLAAARFGAQAQTTTTSSDANPTPNPTPTPTPKKKRYVLHQAA